jgi:predicted dehydrogenase
MEPEPLRGVVVGCRMGRGHARAIDQTDGLALVAVCDLNEDTAREAAEPFDGVAVYTAFGQMLEEEHPHVVAIATPTDSHAALTVQAAGAGVRGICCEKPMALKMRDGRAMVCACRERGIALIVNYQRRMSGPMVAMRRLIEEGVIGEPRLLRAACAGDMLSDGTHAVDSIRALAGDEPVKWVLGQVYRAAPDPAAPRGQGYHSSGGYRYGHPIESGALALLEFESGLRAELLTGGARPPNSAYQEYRAMGSEGQLWRNGDRAEPPLLIWDGREGGWRGVPPGSDADGHGMRESYVAFARMIREGTPHPLDGESALADLEIVMAVYESARLNRRIELPLRQDDFPLQLMIDEGRL